MIESRPEEKCFYCDALAEYSQLVGEEGSYTVAGVCKKHLTMGLSS
jgi:hypothetical protein